MGQFRCSKSSSRAMKQAFTVALGLCLIGGAFAKGTSVVANGYRYSYDAALVATGNSAISGGKPCGSQGSLASYHGSDRAPVQSLVKGTSVWVNEDTKGGKCPAAVHNQVLLTDCAAVKRPYVCRTSIGGGSVPHPPPPPPSPRAPSPSLPPSTLPPAPSKSPSSPPPKPSPPPSGGSGGGGSTISIPGGFGAPVFPSRPNNLRPVNPTWGPGYKAPLPTNAWFTPMGSGINPQYAWITPYPYSVAGNIPPPAGGYKGLDILYPDNIQTTTHYSLTELSSDWGLKAKEALQDSYLQSYGPLVVTVRWNAMSGSGSMRSPVARGSAYQTMIYTALTPVISANAAITTINGKSVQDGATVTGTRFVITTNTKQTWVVWTSSALTFRVTVAALSNLVASGPFTGIIRTSYVTAAVTPAQLDAHVNTYVTGGTVDALQGSGQFRFTFTTASARLSPVSTSTLLMLALPHHISAGLSNKRAGMDLAWPTAARGKLTGVLGNTWLITPHKSTATWYQPRQPDSDKLSAVLSALAIDVNSLPYDSTDPYFFGTQVAAIGRAALIADSLHRPDLAAAARSRLKVAIEPWLTGKNSNPLVYDTTWGGIVTTNGLKDQFTDFGNAVYNDHHFQYGYHIFACAAIAKGDPSWLAAHQAPINNLLRDYANPRDDPYFLRARSFDFFEGHSWAGGLYVFADGNNQESSSEAVNSYYAAMLMGVVQGNADFAAHSRLLMDSEIASAQMYWHITKPRPAATTIWPAPFNENAEVGILWSTKADFSTWFGTNIEYMYGIQWIPFTPISSTLLDKDYISQVWPKVSVALTRADPPLGPEWLSWMCMAYSIIDKPAAWALAQQRVPSLTQNIPGLGRGEIYHFIATRP